MQVRCRIKESDGWKATGTGSHYRSGGRDATRTGGKGRRRPKINCAVIQEAPSIGRVRVFIGPGMALSQGQD